MIPFLYLKVLIIWSIIFYFISQRHANIKFTRENEADNKLAFMDVAVIKSGNVFLTSVFRKTMFSGKGMNFFSYIYPRYKIAAVRTLLFRAYEVSSNAILFQNEVTFLRNYFMTNKYPLKLFNKILCNFLADKLDFKPVYDSVAEMKMFLELPFIGKNTETMVRELQSVMSEFYPHIKPNFYFKSQRKIKSFFPLKDVTPVMMDSGLIYKYTCDCSQSYIGSTTTNLYIRICQHEGNSHRTGAPLTNPSSSSIREHCLRCKSAINRQNFSIVDRHDDEGGLRILESIYIKENKPGINECKTAVPLHIY